MVTTIRPPRAPAKLRESDVQLLLASGEPAPARLAAAEVFWNLRTLSHYHLLRWEWRGERLPRPDSGAPAPLVLRVHGYEVDSPYQFDDELRLLPAADLCIGDELTVNLYERRFLGLLRDRDLQP